MFHHVSTIDPHGSARNASALRSRGSQAPPEVAGGFVGLIGGHGLIPPAACVTLATHLGFGRGADGAPCGNPMDF